MIKNNKKTKVAIIIFLITAIIATVLTAVLAFGESDEGYRTITVIEIQGTVGVVHNNIEYAAYTGMHLEEGYTVVTGGNSYIRLLLDDDKYVKLESGTKAVFSELSGGKTAINIERGALVAEVTKPLQVDEDFIVNTPNAILAVRGTLFRVDLSRNDKGELNTDVLTYGGAVSSKRIQPNGEVEEAEVTIKKGFKATVNMDDKKTVYLVDDVKVDLSSVVGTPSGNENNNTTNINGAIIENAPVTLESVLMPIVVTDIPDDDLVDIYFASENGHSMFIETEEIKTQIEDRNIDITQKASIYEIAENVKESADVAVPDDNKPLLTTTEPETEQAIAVQGTPNDGIGETTAGTTTVPSAAIPATTVPTTIVPSTTVPTTTVPTTTVPSTTVPSTTVPSTTAPTTESTTVPTTEPTTEITTTQTTVHTHTETVEETPPTCKVDGKRTVKCSDCGEILSEAVLNATGHTEKITTGEAICTVDGKKTVTCEICGELISETVITATGHKAIFSGTKDAHTECEICYEILSADHTYKTSTTNASCTLDGGTTYVCECGYNYTDTIPATGHTEKTATVDATCTVDGKTTVSCTVCSETLSETVIPAKGHTEENGAGADIHTKCSVCGNTVKDGTYHDYTDEVTTPETCTTEGVRTHTCTCGWSYTEAIPASHKKSDDGLTCVNGCGGVWVDLNSTNFPDSMFLSYISTTYDADGNNALIGDEITGVVTINIAGNSSTDGGYTDLTGIKHFANLVNVNCAYNSGIESLDLSGLTSLTNLDITGLTGLKTLNISGCTNLKDEKITGLDTCTELTTLNVSGCTNISELNLNSNTKVETVNLSNCNALTSFVMGDDTVGNYLLNSIDLTGCNNLETLEINSAMYLTSFDFTDKTKIKSVDLGGCQGITYLAGLSGKTSLQSLDIAALNKITEIDVSGCSALTNLSITACSALETLNLGYSGVTTFNSSTDTMNLSSYTNLKNVYLHNFSAPFKTIEVSNNTELKEFAFSANNYITTLEFSESAKLELLMLADLPNLSTLIIDDYSDVYSLNVMNTGLKSLTVTEAGALTIANVYNNNMLESLSISGATLLDTIKLSGGYNNTKMTSLTLNKCGLTMLEVDWLTALATLDITDTTAITYLDISNTNINNLNTSGVYDLNSIRTLKASNAGIDDTEIASMLKPTLELIDISNNSMVTSIDLSGNENLKSLNVSKTGITELITTECTSLEMLDASECTALDCFSMSTNNSMQYTALQSVNVSGCTSMTLFELADATNLESLDLSGLTSLKIGRAH